MGCPRRCVGKTWASGVQLGGAIQTFAALLRALERVERLRAGGVRHPSLDQAERGVRIHVGELLDLGLRLLDGRVGGSKVVARDVELLAQLVEARLLRRRISDRRPSAETALEIALVLVAVRRSLRSRRSAVSAALEVGAVRRVRQLLGVCAFLPSSRLVLLQHARDSRGVDGAHPRRATASAGIVRDDMRCLMRQSSVLGRDGPAAPPGREGISTRAVGDGCRRVVGRG